MNKLNFLDLPKTPKGKDDFKKSTTSLTSTATTKSMTKNPTMANLGTFNSPDKSKPIKELAKTPTHANLKSGFNKTEENSKTMNKNPTVKNLTNDKTSSLMKSNTKGNLLKKDKEQVKDHKTPQKEIKKDQFINKNGKHEEKIENGKNSTKPTHPTREENVSSIIGVVETNNNDELLTGSDPLMVSGFADKNEVNNTKNETKLDIGEILDDRYSNFSR